MANSIVFSLEDSQIMDECASEYRRRNDPDCFGYWGATPTSGYSNTPWFKNSEVPEMSVRLLMNASILGVQICTTSHAEELKNESTRFAFDNNAATDTVCTSYTLLEISVICATCKNLFYRSSMRPQHIVMPFYYVTDHSSVSVANHLSCQNESSERYLAAIEVKLGRCSKMARTTASDILLKLMDEQLCTDVTLRVDKHKDLRAHRAILAAHSPVFKSMFENSSFLESQQGLVNFKDIKPEVLEAALECLYGKKVAVDFGAEVQMDLLVFADCYELADLKAQCEESLSVCSFVNLLELLALADRHHADILKEAIIRRIVSLSSRKELFCGPVAARFIKDHTELALQLMSCM